MKYTKIIVLNLVITFSLLHLAIANESARTYIQNELSTIGKQIYGMSSYELGNYLGVINKEYTFEINYTKEICADQHNISSVQSHSKSTHCVTLSCESKISLDGDAVISLEEPNRCTHTH